MLNFQLSYIQNPFKLSQNDKKAKEEKNNSQSSRKTKTLLSEMLLYYKYFQTLTLWVRNGWIVVMHTIISVNTVE